MENKIIVYPTDFSVCAKNALPYLKAISKASMAKVIVLHSIDLIPEYASQLDVSSTATLIKAAEEKGNNLLLELKQELENESISCETNLISSLDNNWLQSSLNEIKPYLVIMGTNGANEIENKLFGSLTFKVINKSAYPVLAIPSKAKFSGIHHVLFATDFKEKDVQHVQFVVDITKAFYPKLEIIHVANSQFRDKAEDLYLRDFEDELFSKVNYGKMKVKIKYADEIVDGIKNSILKSKSDLVVLVGSEKTFFERIFSHSVTKHLIYNCETPLLIF